MKTHRLSTALVSLNAFAALALIASGCSGGSSSAPPVYEFDPAGAQIIVGSLNTARVDHQMTSIAPATSEVLITGGMTITGATNTAEMMNVTTGQSRPVAALMTQARAGHVAASDGQSKVALFGGVDQNLVVLDSVEVYDAQTDLFTASSERLLEPRVNAAVVVDGDRVVIAGGGDVAGDTLEVWSLSQMQRIGRFDSLAGTKREDVQLVRINSEVYFLYGGNSGQPNLWIDLGAGTATPAENRVRHGGTAFAAPFAPGAALVVGGFDEFNKFQRGVQVVRPGQQDGDLEVLGFGLFFDRVRPVALGADEGLYFLGGLGGAIVSPVERVGPEGAELFQDLFGAPRNMQALRLGVDHVVSSGGLGPDNTPLALVNILIPAVGDGDGIFDFNQARALASAQLNQDITAAQGQLANNQNNLAATNNQLGQTQNNLQTQVGRGQSLQAAIDAANQRIPQLQNEIQTLQGQIPGLQDQVTQLQAQGQQSATQLQQAQSALSSAQGQLNALTIQLNAANNTVITLTAQLP